MKLAVATIVIPISEVNTSKNNTINMSDSPTDKRVWFDLQESDLDQNLDENEQQLIIGDESTISKKSLHLCCKLLSEFSGLFFLGI